MIEHGKPYYTPKERMFNFRNFITKGIVTSIVIVFFVLNYKYPYCLKKKIKINYFIEHIDYRDTILITGHGNLRWIKIKAMGGTNYIYFPIDADTTM